MGAREHDRARRQYEDMARRLAELDRIDGIDLSSPPSRQVPVGADPSSSAGGNGPRDYRLAGERTRLAPRTRSTLLVTLLLVVALVLGTGAWRQVLDVGSARTGTGEAAAPAGGSDDVVVAAGQDDSPWPPLPADASASRLAPVVVAGSTGPHAFVSLRPDGSPVVYDPCRPLRVVVNPSGMPDGGLQLVREAADAVSAATGLVLVDEGVTDEPLTEQRDPRQPQRYGQRWAPVLVGWGDASTFPLLSGEIAGLAGSAVVAPSGPGSERFVSGQVALDRQDFADILAEPRGYRHARAIVMHELAHVVGLAHVEDPAELMYERNTGVTDFGPGDRQGLAALGAGPCLRDT